LLNDDLCAGTLRLAAIADPDIVGAPASVWQVERQLERASDLGAGAVESDEVQRTYDALLRAGFVVADRLDRLLAGVRRRLPGAGRGGGRVDAGARQGLVAALA
jgi:hypothetical protein